MSLPSGTRIGPYEITAQIGAGGMGEVYRATDSHLKRAVAIKVLPALVADDPERLARFQREAEMLAAVQVRGTDWAAGPATRIIDGRYSTRNDQISSVVPQFDTFDGQRFLMLKDEALDSGRPASEELIVVQNWFEELKRLVPID